jgi:hypothetical protein
MASYMDAVEGKHTDGREQGIAMTRDEMVEYLVDSDYDYIIHSRDGGGLELLDSYLRNGFKGYEAYTLEELTAEVAQRKEMENA